MTRPKRRKSPQQKWADKQKLRGNCSRCGQPRQHYKVLCDFCQGKQTLYMRKWRADQRIAKALAEATQ